MAPLGQNTGYLGVYRDQVKVQISRGRKGKEVVERSRSREAEWSGFAMIPLAVARRVCDPRIFTESLAVCLSKVSVAARVS